MRTQLLADDDDAEQLQLEGRPVRRADLTERRAGAAHGDDAAPLRRIGLRPLLQLAQLEELGCADHIAFAAELDGAPASA